MCSGPPRRHWLHAWGPQRRPPPAIGLFTPCFRPEIPQIAWSIATKTHDQYAVIIPAIEEKILVILGMFLIFKNQKILINIL